MSYCPAFDCPSWKALAKNESYGSVRNSTFVPVAFWNMGMMVCLNGARAPSSNAPMTSLPPACAGLGLAADAAVEGEADAAAADAGGDEDAPAPHAARNAAAAPAPPMAAPRRSSSRRLNCRDRIWRTRISSSLIASLLLSGSSAGRRLDGPRSCHRVRRSRPLPGRRRLRPVHPAAPSTLDRLGP